MTGHKKIMIMEIFWCKIKLKVTKSHKDRIKCKFWFCVFNIILLNKTKICLAILEFEKK